jgi:hypothetical protein
MDQEIGDDVVIVATHPNNNKNCARQNTLHPSPPAECASGTFIKHNQPLSHYWRRRVVVFALRRESPISSSGMKVLSVLGNTDQRYTL